MRLFQITEDDLAELERTLPQIFDLLAPEMADGKPAANRVRVQFRRVQEIVTNVRWNYGPWVSVKIIPASGSEPIAQG